MSALAAPERLLSDAGFTFEFLHSEEAAHSGRFQK